jgi:DNA processing protein
LAAQAVDLVAEAEAASFDRSELECWNYFLASELGIHKGSEIFKSLSLRSLLGDPDSVRELVLKHAALTPGGRNSVGKAKIPVCLSEDTGILLRNEFSEYLQYSESSYPALFFRGDSLALNQPTIGIVGTRSATSYGKNCARRFASDFAKAGAVVVSGGAIGIDTAAHEGAIDAGGQTVVVKPSGLDVHYPKLNEMLFERVAQNGCLVSQFQFGMSPRPESFLQRNHLIAALSQVVVIIEAPPGSGAIRTAVNAAEMGREVFVVPGPIDQRNFIGSHALIKDGCTFVDHPDQVLEAMGIEPGSKKKVEPQKGTAGEILKVLSAESMSVEEIVEKTALESSEILAELTILELDGNVIRENGRYSKPI